MAATSLSAKHWQELISQLAIDYPAIAFANGSKDSWSPSTKLVIINESEILPIRAWSLLHELSHALLDHQSYISDFELLRLEVQAWQKAKQIANNYHIQIDEDHIQDCLDSYRDWLHKRSTCPDCQLRAAQNSINSYKCYNCGLQWQVSESRLKRPYRKMSKVTL